MIRLLPSFLLTCALALSGCSIPWPGGGNSSGPQELTPALAGRAPAVPPPSQPLPTQTVFSWADLADAELGIGYLGPPPEAGEANQWTREMTLPIFADPSGEQSGWLVNGWVQKTGAGEPVPLTALGMVEAAPDLLAFIVLGKSRDGWFRFRYDRPEPENDGTAWAHENHLALGPAPLEVRLWRTQFLEPGYAPLFFRNKKASHALREAPALNGRLITWIGRSHDLEPLETRGDWMKVRVTQPSQHCNGKKPQSLRTHEGWTRVRHPESGLWVWYHTEPCP